MNVELTRTNENLLTGKSLSGMVALLIIWWYDNVLMPVYLDAVIILHRAIITLTGDES